MSNLPAIAEPQEVAGKALTVEQSVEFKLQAYQALAVELKAFIAKGVPTIAGIGDKVGYAKVSEWRKKAMRARTGLDAHRKELTEESRKYQALVNSKAKEITAEIESVEDALFAEEDRIDKLIEADKAAKQKIIDDRVNARTQALLAVNGLSSVRLETLAGMPEEVFQEALKAATTIFNEEKRKREEAEAELARLQAEEAERQRAKAELEAAERKAEAERLEAQRKAQEEAQAKIDAQLAEIARQQKEIEDAKAAQKAQEEAQARKEAEAKAEEERKAREAKIAAEAAEAARIEAERQAEEKRKQDEAKAKAEAARLAAIEAARPDADKLIRYAESLLAMPLPEMATKAGQDACKHAVTQVEALALDITKLAQSLTK